MTDYCTLSELKSFLSSRGSSNFGSNDDTELSAKITAASRRIDKDTGRPHGYGQDSVTSQRTYKPTHPELLMVDDISTVTGLVVEVGASGSFTTVDASFYDYLPENALADSLAIECIRRTSGWWPTSNPYYRVRVTAKWGWAAVPDEIKAACLLLAGRLFTRKASPLGVAGSNDFQGVIRVARTDPDYDALIAPFVRPEL